jgi:hypothetical protein
VGHSSREDAPWTGVSETCRHGWAGEFGKQSWCSRQGPGLHSNQQVLHGALSTFGQKQGRLPGGGGGGWGCCHKSDRLWAENAPWAGVSGMGDDAGMGRVSEASSDNLVRASFSHLASTARRGPLT